MVEPGGMVLWDGSHGKNCVYHYKYLLNTCLLLLPGCSLVADARLEVLIVWFLLDKSAVSLRGAVLRPLSSQNSSLDRRPGSLL